MLNISQAELTVSMDEASQRKQVLDSSSSFTRMISSLSQSVSSNTQLDILCAAKLMPSLARGMSDDRNPYSANLFSELRAALVSGPEACSEITTCKNGSKYTTQSTSRKSYVSSKYSFKRRNDWISGLSSWISSSREKREGAAHRVFSRIRVIRLCISPLMQVTPFTSIGTGNILSISSFFVVFFALHNQLNSLLSAHNI